MLNLKKWVAGSIDTPFPLFFVCFYSPSTIFSSMFVCIFASACVCVCVEGGGGGVGYKLSYFLA